MGAFCGGYMNSFQLPNIHLLNQYKTIFNSQQINEQIFERQFKKLFGQSQNNKLQLNLKNKYRNLIAYLNSKQNIIFQDPNFILSQGSTSISKLYDYTKKNMILCDNKNKQGNQICQQLKLQFSYLSSVIYFLCKNKQFLLNRVLLTKQIHNNHIYSIRFFSNGQEQIIIVDDKIPTEKQRKIQYSKCNSKQIWPLIVEKAWCKQIGSYNKARGLSPSECFQEITGIPTYQYHLDTISPKQALGIINDYLLKSYWVSVVARRQVSDVQTSQVFLINKISGQNIFLTSPYTKFRLNSTNNQNQKGTIQLNIQRFYQNFQYLIVGYYNKGYQPLSFPIKSQKKQQKIFAINVKKSQQISVRLVQFYRQYLGSRQFLDQRNSYEYSPMAIFQLYDQNHNLLNFCQGCYRIDSGAHSIHYTSNIFHQLNKGIYYLRMQIDWNYPELLNQANLVVYCSKSNVQITQLSYSQKQQKIRKLHISTLNNLPNSIIVQPNQQPFRIKYFTKRNNILFSIQNISGQLIRLELDFKGSYNFRIKDHKIGQNKKLILNLASKELKLVEVLPDDLRPQSNIEMCTIRKIQISQ